MFQESEVLNLILTLLVTVFFLIFSRDYRRPHFPFLYLGFLLMLLALIFTIAEGAFFPVFLNLAEHLCYAASGIFFLIGCLRLTRKEDNVGG
jgi:prepilin signal peptidase PulO-like enzyme (type II secretory pathway)